MVGFLLRTLIDDYVVLYLLLCEILVFIVFVFGVERYLSSDRIRVNILSQRSQAYMVLGSICTYTICTVYKRQDIHHLTHPFNLNVLKG
jgi:hypothetical protein